jgi:hypothetical protein
MLLAPQRNHHEDAYQEQEKQATKDASDHSADIAAAGRG